MPTSPRTDIMAEVVRRLLQIGQGNGWASGASPTVFRRRLPPSNVAQWPFALVYSPGEGYDRYSQQGAGSLYDRELEIVIEYYAIAEDNDEATGHIVHDVERALRDWTLKTEDNDATANDCVIQNYTAGLADVANTLTTAVVFTVLATYRTQDQTPSVRA